MGKIIVPRDVDFKIVTNRETLETANIVFYMGLTWEKNFFKSCYSERDIESAIRNQELWIK